jgi:glycosyltransferase involved in cell wall biosynthesis
MDKTTGPLVSVILPIYNCQLYIKESVESILNQTFTDFELIIIDDASTDGTFEIVEKIIDPRIRLIKKPKNSGYTESLNLGLELSKGLYIARMDGDDISLPNRFKEQVKLLNENQNIIVCGTWFQLSHNKQIIKHPSSHEEIKLALLEYCAIGHPTVMFRKEVYSKYHVKYDSTMEPAEDYNLWVNVLPYGDLFNIPVVHLIYRSHDEQTSIKKKIAQQENSLKAKERLLSYLNPLVNIASEITFDYAKADENKLKFLRYEYGIAQLIKANDERSFFENSAFRTLMNTREKRGIIYFFQHSGSFDWGILYLFLINKNKYYKYFTIADRVKIIFKNLIRWRG